MEMSKYILQILRASLTTVFSWGFHSPRATQEGLMFKVRGFIHQGWVHIKYNEGSDLFDVDLLSPQRECVETIESVSFDDLVYTIDQAVERVPDYDERVKRTYYLQ